MQLVTEPVIKLVILYGLNVLSKKKIRIKNLSKVKSLVSTFCDMLGDF